MSYRIVSDSSSNILKLDNADYKSVPLTVVLGEKQFVDDENLDVRAMVEEMSKSKEKCSTSCPNVFDWLEAFKGASECFAVTITSNLSGCYAAAVQAKNDFLNSNSDAKICVIDSLSTGPEMELIIEKLQELSGEGVGFEEAEKAVREYLEKTHLFVSLESLNNLAKNGRVSHTVAKIAGVLGIRVVGTASEDGYLEPIHKCRGEKKALETMKNEVLKKGFKGGKLRIAHCENPSAAEKFKNMILEVYPESDIKIRESTGLCSFYAEKGGCIIAFEA